MRTVCFRSFVALCLAAAVVLAQPKKTIPAGSDRTNFLNCVRGVSGCDVSALNAADLTQVSTAAKERNIDYCLEGSALCDPTSLPAAKVPAVQAARYRRNLEKCVN